MLHIQMTINLKKGLSQKHTDTVVQDLKEEGATAVMPGAVPDTLSAYFVIQNDHFEPVKARLAVHPHILEVIIDSKEELAGSGGWFWNE